jgi:hypothetical protein
MIRTLVSSVNKDSVRAINNNRSTRETVKSVSKPFQLSIAISSANEVTMIPSVRDRECHAKGPFGNKDVNRGIVNYCGKVSLKQGSRAVRFRKPDSYAYIQRIMSELPKDYESSSPSFNNVLLVTPS